MEKTQCLQQVLITHIQWFYYGKSCFTHSYFCQAEELPPVKSWARSINKYFLNSLFQPLRSRCKVQLFQTISIDNCVTYFKLAYLHNCNKLKEKAMDLIGQNFKTIRTTPAFRDLMTQTYYSEASVELMSFLAEKFISSTWLGDFTWVYRTESVT